MATQYNANTGQALAAGESQPLYNDKTGQQIGNSSDTKISQTDLASFQKANPGLDFTQQDLTHYKGAPTVTPSLATGSINPLTIPPPPINTAPAATSATAPGAVQTNPDGTPVNPNITDANNTANGLIGTGAQDKANVANNQSTIESLINDIAGKGQRTTDLQLASGITDQEKQLADIRTQAAQEQVAQRARAAAIASQPGVTRAFVNDQAQAAADASARRLADFKIIESAALQNVDSIKQAVKERVDLEFAGKDQKLAYYEQLQKENKDKITADDSKRFQVAYDQFKSKLQEEKDAKTEIFNLGAEAAKNGAPSSVVEAVNNSKTKQEALVAAAKYMSNPLDAELKKAQIAEAWAKAKQTTGGSTVTNILPGTNEYKIAQDLAYGSLTFSQFKSLYSYSRNVGAKTSIYAKAAELNPNFSPAQFELGYKIATNPQIRQQVSAADNALSRIDSLKELSDKATRTGIPLINKMVLPAGYEIGGKKYSDFHVAQVAMADEISGALGFGSASDLKTKLGIDITDPNLSPTQFNSALDEVSNFLVSKRQSIVNQMGVYAGDINALSSGAPISDVGGNTNSKDPLNLFKLNPIK